MLNQGFNGGVAIAVFVVLSALPLVLSPQPLVCCENPPDLTWAIVDTLISAGVSDTLSEQAMDQGFEIFVNETMGSYADTGVLVAIAGQIDQANFSARYFYRLDWIAHVLSSCSKPSKAIDIPGDAEVSGKKIWIFREGEEKKEGTWLVTWYQPIPGFVFEGGVKPDVWVVVVELQEQAGPTSWLSYYWATMDNNGHLLSTVHEIEMLS